MIQIFAISYDNILFEQVRQIREEVFVEEQNVPLEIEYEFEEESIHYLAFYEDEAIATARYRKTEEGIKLERFATLEEYRNKGIGAAILNKMLHDIRKENKMVYLNAQEVAVKFYEKHGFEVVGEMFMEAGIKHFRMELVKTKDRKM
ncbi:MAG: GNAT family N-acetyltransferase [Bacteroidetes bacterium]|nr:GNAT family N-acetyltransferase [Bacteroidota bacterium]